MVIERVLGQDQQVVKEFEKTCGGELTRAPYPEEQGVIIDTKSHYESKAMLKGGATISGTFGGTHNPQKRGYNQRSKS